MTNEERAEEIANGYGTYSNSQATGASGVAYHAAMAMAEWKDEHFAKEKQQMKGVKLTWKDMREIVAISDRMLIQKGNLDDKGFFEAVLEQFKALKGE